MPVNIDELLPTAREIRRQAALADAEELMVPRGGIELSPIHLKVHHFLSDDFPVYLPVDPELS